MNRKEFHIRKRLKKVSKYITYPVLDLGCKNYPNPYIHNAVGIDLCKCTLPKNYKQCIEYDLNKGLPNNLPKFNTILACEVLEHLENTGIFLESCFTKLNDNGRLIITIPNIHSFVNHAIYKGHINLLDPESLCNNLSKKGFTHIKILRLHRFFIEFPSWWVLIIAQKRG